MSVYSIGSGVFRLKEGLVNCYLIEEDEGVTVLDAAWPRSFGHLEQALTEIGRSPGDVRAIVLTHGHPDHVGSAEHARQAWGVPVLVNRDESDRVKGRAKGSSPFSLVPGLLPHLWRPSATGFVLHATAHGFMTPTWVKEVTTFEDGDVLDVPGRPRAVSTPGHTEGHTSFHLPDRGILFAGDALVTLDVLTRETGPRLLPDPLNGDTARARSSLGRLSGLEAETVLPGHGDPWHGELASAVELARNAS
ncbi:MBL fold metallo-hydrolase [soil metagenome]